MQDDDENQFDIGNQDHFDNAPDEFKDHMVQAFIHAAGKGKHPGKYKGAQPEPPPDDAITEGDLQRTHEEEANASKMRAAQTGGGDQSLGPSAMDQAAVKQGQAASRQASQQAAQQAAQAQAQQVPVNAPPAPSGAAGATIPFPAQKGAVGGPGNAPQPSLGAQPPQPPPQEPPPNEEEGPPQ